MRHTSLFFAALADPTRLRLLHLMKDGEKCVCYLQGVLRTNQPKISRHLAYLKRAGLVEARREGKWMHYRLKKQGKELEAVLLPTLKHLGREVQAREDLKRLKKICCAPSRYGITSLNGNGARD
jgi:ArsR family transcriptional regulator